MSSIAFFFRLKSLAIPYNTFYLLYLNNLCYIAAYYVIFLSFDNPNTPEGVDDSVSNPMPSPMESIMAMFLMSLTSFSDYYSAFDRTNHEIEAKVTKLFAISSGFYVTAVHDGTKVNYLLSLEYIIAQINPKFIETISILKEKGNYISS